MLLNRPIKEELNELFLQIRLKDPNSETSLDKKVKIEQILAYLEVIHSEIRRRSKKKKIVIIDSAAGNCYLSYVINYFYTKIDIRPIEIHCVDYNANLMERNKKQAKELGFDNMIFYACDINDFDINQKVDVVYSLHACDTATDKTMYLGIRTDAKFIFSVSCCQKSLSIKSKNMKSVIRHKSFRDKTLMMIADSLRALLLERKGYKVDIFDFVSSRYTDKNTMVRAEKASPRMDFDFVEEYDRISQEFRIKPYLDELLVG